MKKVYVAGPYTKGDVAINVNNAIAAANVLADLGYAPFVPHLGHHWDMMFPRPYEFWLELNYQYLACCDAVLRIPGESSGADSEVLFGQRLGIPVFHSIDELKVHFEQHKII